MASTINTATRAPSRDGECSAPACLCRIPRPARLYRATSGPRSGTLFYACAATERSAKCNFLRVVRTSSAQPDAADPATVSQTACGAGNETPHRDRAREDAPSSSGLASAPASAGLRSTSDPTGRVTPAAGHRCPSSEPDGRRAYGTETPSCGATRETTEGERTKAVQRGTGCDDATRARLLWDERDGIVLSNGLYIPSVAAMDEMRRLERDGGPDGRREILRRLTAAGVPRSTAPAKVD